MADFTLDVYSEEQSEDYPVIKSKFEDQSVQRRATTNKRLIAFKITSPVLTETGWEAWRDFFESKTGALTKFTYESVLDGETYTVHFKEGSGLKSRMINGVRRCEAELVVVDEEET